MSHIKYKLSKSTQNLRLVKRAEVLKTFNFKIKPAQNFTF
jgi:hypothetical protein